MSDILLSFGVQSGSADVDRIQKGLQTILSGLDSNPPMVKVGLTVDSKALEHFKSQLRTIVNSVALPNGAPISINISGLGEVTAEAGRAKSAVEGVTNAIKEQTQATKEAAKQSSSSAQQTEKAETKRLALIKRSNSLLSQMRDAEVKWTKARNGTTQDSYKNVVAYRQELESLHKQYLSGQLSSSSFEKQVASLSSRFGEARTQIHMAGEDTKMFSERLGGLASKFSTWFSVSQAVMLAVQSLKKMVNTVVEIDTAMTELKKVTSETDATYTKFLGNASERAKALGATLTDTISTTADFARLGHGIEDASSLSDVAIIYKHIGDGIEDVATASESIISTMQAFGIEASESMTIVDKFNEVGNRFAISSGGIGEAMQRSSAAMHAANNTIDETIALITAANTIVQNPESVGKNLPNNAAMRCKKTAISVKGRRRFRPSKDLVVIRLSRGE